MLENTRIIKVGILPFTDSNYMYNDYDIGVESTVDLRYMARLAMRNPGGLARMSKDYLEIEFDQTSNISYSDWNAPTLSDDQVNYAENKVICAIKLFEYFAEKIEPQTRISNKSERHQYIINKYLRTYINQDYN